jgi:hypothetical protein
MEEWIAAVRDAGKLSEVFPVSSRYLHRAPVDMRKQIDGLAILAKDVVQQDPTSGALFCLHQRSAQQTEAVGLGTERLCDLIQATRTG